MNPPNANRLPVDRALMYLPGSTLADCGPFGVWKSLPFKLYESPAVPESCSRYRVGNWYFFLFNLASSTFLVSKNSTISFERSAWAIFSGYLRASHSMNGFLNVLRYFLLVANSSDDGRWTFIPRATETELWPSHGSWPGKRGLELDLVVIVGFLTEIGIPNS
ncbi:hypothetical protein OGATHE_005532 [Ogataea polymorpha]|uniref:Uncharacterized protein n=1 Tax=Ogataea polymorpha TaxID=460523 RepID=A0A9P8NUL0_9ASCO|nr:hypothetical protein OGATHE_005532 [Ogataea polymorpha]